MSRRGNDLTHNPPAALAFRWFDVLPGVGFGVLYLSTLSRTLSLTHDSAHFLDRISALTPMAMPNHLWFEAAMTAAVRTASWIRPGSDAQMVVEAVNAIAGALALQALYLHGIWRLGMSRATAALVAACGGLTYGAWYYSVSVEAYMPPLALSLWALLGFTRPSLRWTTTIAATAAHATAVLMHQNALLLAPVAAAALMTAPEGWRRGLRHLLAYGVLSTLLTGTAYITAARDAGYGHDVRQTAKWAAGALPQRKFWTRPPRAVAEAAVGYSRAAVGGHVAFAVPSVAGAVRQAFPRHNFADEQFFVRSLTRVQVAWMLLASACAVGVLASLVLRAAWQLVTMRGARPSRVLCLTAAWWALACMFFTFWDAANPDFWIPAVILTPLLAAAASQQVAGRVPAAPFALLAAALVLVTGLGTIRLARDPGNDFYSVYVRSTRLLSADDVLVMGDAWPVRTHLRLHSQVTPVYLSAEFRRREPHGIVDALARAGRNGRRIFVGPDVLAVDPSTSASFGPDYATFVDTVRRRFCGLGAPLGERGEMPLREVTCFHPR
jgi:hypothetical protein